MTNLANSVAASRSRTIALLGHHRNHRRGEGGGRCVEHPANRVHPRDPGAAAGHSPYFSVIMGASKCPARWRY